VGRTAKAVTGFRGRSGRTFRAKLRLEQAEEGKWRVEFDEDWAKEPPKGESEEERAEGETTKLPQREGADGDAEPAEAPAARSA
jgi:DNA topoisomerase-3